MSSCGDVIHSGGNKASVGVADVGIAPPAAIPPLLGVVGFRIVWSDMWFRLEP